jgi:glycerol-3-phosphate cytidylyltransferase
MAIHDQSIRERQHVGLRIGYAPGAFDLLHIGHLNILKHAKADCDYLIAGVVSDEILENVKGRRPVVPLVERLEIVRNISYVDKVYAETIPDKLKVWEELRFTVFFKGDDWRGKPEGKRLEQAFGEVGVEVVYFPYTVHTSSTMLRHALGLTVNTEADSTASSLVR